jgi:hypothetical protein
MPSPLDHVMDAVRTQLEVRRKDALERTALVRTAVDAYLAALEREALGDILERVGGRVGGAPPKDEGPTPREAARALRAAVEQLPELTANKIRKPAKPARVEPPPAPKATAARGTLAAKLPIPASLQTKHLAGNTARAVAPQCPTLLAASKKKKVLVVGGLQKRDKLPALEAFLGFVPEWVETDGASANAIRNVEGRILDGRIAGVVVLEGVMGHTHVEPLVRASRQTGTPFAYADRGGKASLERAFADLEEALSE